MIFCISSHMFVIIIVIVSLNMIWLKEHNKLCRYLNDVHMLEIKEGTSLQWQSPEIEGPVPPVRDSHTALTWGNKLIIYGGMNGRRLGDVWILETDPWKWTNVTTQGIAPTPRSLHVATIIKNRSY